MLMVLERLTLEPWVPAASKAGEKTAEEAQSPSLPLPSPVPTPEEVKPKPDDNPFAGLLNSCVPLLPYALHAFS